MAEFHIKNKRTALERIEKALSPLYFTDVNLRGRLYEDARPVSGLAVHHAGGRISFQDARSATYEKTQVGDSYGPTWSTHWFQVHVEVPEEWTCKSGDDDDDDDGAAATAECDEVHLLWECEGECLLFRDGQPVAGLTTEGEKTSYVVGRARRRTPPPSSSSSSAAGFSGTAEDASGRRKDAGNELATGKTAAPIDLTTSTKKSLPPARSFTAYVEMACNGLFGAGKGSMIAPPDPERKFALKRAAVALFRRDVYELLTDLEVIYEVACGLAGEADGRGGEQLGYRALYCGNAVVSACADAPRPGPAGAAPAGDDGGDTREWVRHARAISGAFFSEPWPGCGHGSERGAVVAGGWAAGYPGTVVHAMGHCHIDTAWLWPYEETVRKCARSWATALQLMDRDPEFTFVCSQAQQLSWLKRRYPRSLYPRVRAAVARGAFVPVGGTWVEFDGNLPSGESLVRQFLLGQRFFLHEFGARCDEFWLPDTFGYSAQLPQIMTSCGARRFVTQKLSWNLVNAFPHSTFHWEGLDGTRVLTHFPPAESYECKVRVKEILKSASNNRDKGRTQHALLLYGFGDGGGGPTLAMLDRLRRVRSVAGLPRATSSTPARFFNAVEAEVNQGERGGGSGGVGRLCTWSGELFLEMHNGTYTTQARVKRGNRRCEALLRDAEALCCLALLTQSPVYAAERAESSGAGDGCGETRDESKSGTASEGGNAMPGTNASSGGAGGKANDDDDDDGDDDDDEGDDAMVLGYPRQQLTRLWEGVLLNQFHDVLPGSCTRQVARDAEEIYGGVEIDAEQIARDAMAAVVQREPGAGDFPRDPIAFFNTLGWERTEVAALPGRGVNGYLGRDRFVPNSKIVYGRYVKGDERRSDKADGTDGQEDASAGLVLVTVPAFGYSIYSEASLLAGAAKSLAVILHHESDSRAVLENDLLRVSVDGAGRLTSLIHKPSGREAVTPGQKANQLVMFDDVPLYWDAWDVMDYHLETRKPQERTSEPLRVLTDAAGIRVAVRACLQLGERSRATVDISLDAGSPFVRFDVTATWHENRRFLKTEFPVAVRSGGEATYEIQFGHVRRPTHRNTSWDWPRYEVWAHRWAHLGEHGFGLALLNDCKYGHSARGNVLSLSLLRSPKAPDPEADMGEHAFAYAAMPHEGSFQDAGVIRCASAFNHPLRAQRASSSSVAGGAQNSSMASSVAPESSSKQDAALTVDAAPAEVFNEEASPSLPAAPSGDPRVKRISQRGFFTVEPSSVVVETLKLAEGWPGHAGTGVVLVVRLYESHGGAAVARLRCRCSPDLPLISAVPCNMLEDADDSEPPLVVKDEGDDDDEENSPEQVKEGDDGPNQKQAKRPQSGPAWRCVFVPFKAFQIRTLSLHFGQPTLVL
ncbi:alpha-mannosidase 2C1 [Lampetra fluviatilis]